jgi:hypothetical protein
MMVDLDDAERKMIVRVLEAEIKSTVSQVGEMESAGATGVSAVMRAGIRIAERIIAKLR